MSTNNPEFVFVARYNSPKDAVPTNSSSKTPVTRWCSVYGTQEEAYKGAAIFIRDELLYSSLRSTGNKKVIEEIENFVRSDDVESVISFWNEEFPTHKVKIYKGPAL